MPTQVITYDTSKCGICGSSNIYHGGSWTPEKCRDCGAVYFFGQWMEEAKEPKKGERCQQEKK